MKSFEQLVKENCNSFITNVILKTDYTEEEKYIMFFNSLNELNNDIITHVINLPICFFSFKIKDSLLKFSNYELYIFFLHNTNPNISLLNKQEVEKIYQNTKSHYIRELAESKMWLLL